jgi:hypothetical protein
VPSDFRPTRLQYVWKFRSLKAVPKNFNALAVGQNFYIQLIFYLALFGWIFFHTQILKFLDF